MSQRPARDERYAFGPFEVVVAERLLTRGAEPVALRAKVFDTLVVLLRAPGRLVTREELIAAVWPDSIVEEGNLTHNVSALRRALGCGEEADYVETVPRQGYRFVHPLGSPPDPSPAASDELAHARHCLDQGAWDDAYRAFREAARTTALSGPDSASLAQAARWSGRFDELVPLLEGAADAYRREGDVTGTARAVIELATLLLDRGRPALAASCLRQAERALAGDAREASRERAGLLRMQGRLRWIESDWSSALEYSQAGCAAARACRDRDVEALALSDAAHALLALDRFHEAEQYLEEAGAVVMSRGIGPYAAGMTLCSLIYAWRALGRWERAREWSDAKSRWADETGVAYFPGHCRIHRGMLVAMGGELARAEEDLACGTRELTQAASGFVGPGWRELGVVRLRRGDLAGAEEAFARALEVGTDPQPGLALLRAARGELPAARRDLERFLSAEGGATRTLLDRENRFEALAVLVKLALDAGDLAAAREARAAIEAIADGTRSAYHRAVLDDVAGALALAEGRTAAALALLRGSLREWTNLPAPYEAALTRERIGLVFLAERDASRAELEFAGAAETLERLGAVLDARRLGERRRAVLAEDAPRGRRAVACGAIVDSARLESVLGHEAWASLNAWLQRVLTRCWADHGGKTLGLGDGEYAVYFEDTRGALSCVLHVQRSLREHRARHGFAPRLRLVCVEASAIGDAPEAAPLHDLARDLLRGDASADVTVLGAPGAFERSLEIERLRAEGLDVRVLDSAGRARIDERVDRTSSRADA